MVNPAILKDAKYIPDIAAIFDPGFNSFGFVPNSSLLEILLMAKSAWERTTPLELIRIKMSVTCSISNSHRSSTKLSGSSMRMRIFMNRITVMFSVLRSPISSAADGFPTWSACCPVVTLKDPAANNSLNHAGVDFPCFQGEIQDIAKIQHILGAHLRGPLHTDRFQNHDVPLEMGLIDHIQNRVMQIVKCSFRNLSFEIPGFKVTTGQQADQVGKPSAAELIGEPGRYSGSPESAFDYDVKRFNTYENPLEYLEQVEAGELSSFGASALILILISDCK